MLYIFSKRSFTRKNFSNEKKTKGNYKCYECVIIKLVFIVKNLDKNKNLPFIKSYITTPSNSFKIIYTKGVTVPDLCWISNFC